MTIKINKIEEPIKKYRFYLTKDEIKVLKLKYQNQGFYYEQIVEKINGMKKLMKDFVLKLRKKSKKQLSDEEINNKFQEEFARLIEND